MINYKNLFSPIKVGDTGVILKNRFNVGPSVPTFLNGPEHYPTQYLIDYYSRLARNGASIITTRLVRPDGEPSERTLENVVLSGHMPAMDAFDTRCGEGFSKLADAVHMYGTKMLIETYPPTIPGYSISNVLSRTIPHNITERVMEKEMTKEMLKESIEKCVKVCKQMKLYGFDGVFIHGAYRHSLVGRSLSKSTNIRTDEFGGSLENRCRYTFWLCDEIHKACGKDFLIEVSFTGYCDSPGDEWTLEDTKEFTKLAEGHIDIIQPRTSMIDYAHPTGYSKEKAPFTFMAEAARSVNSKVLVTAIAGYFDPHESENLIKNHKADLIGNARAWISNPEYAQLIRDDKVDELVPCIRCNKCLLANNTAQKVSVCSVNPRHPNHYDLDKQIPVIKSKKIAVIGGGPAGMEAAITAHNRGHKVTLFEQSNELGGELNIATIPSFKWPLKDFSEYLINKALKTGFEIRLNTKATPESIAKGDYDVVVVAIGAKQIIPNIKGVDNQIVKSMKDCYLNENIIGKNVVFVGGGEVGVETALHINSKGRLVTIIDMNKMLMPNTSFEHYYTFIEDEWLSRKNFEIKTEATVREITNNSVIYEKGGEYCEVPCDTVIITTGFKNDADEVMKFAGVSQEFFVIGDANKAQSVQEAIADGYRIGCAF